MHMYIHTSMHTYIIHTYTQHMYVYIHATCIQNTYMLDTWINSVCKLTQLPSLQKHFSQSQSCWRLPVLMAQWPMNKQMTEQVWWKQRHTRYLSCYYDWCYCIVLLVMNNIPYSAKQWRGKTLANLANPKQFAKVLPNQIYILKKLRIQSITKKFTGQKYMRCSSGNTFVLWGRSQISQIPPSGLAI